MRQLLLITVYIHFFMGCNSQKSHEYELAIINDSTKVELRLGDTNSLVCFMADSITSEWPIYHPVYQYQYGDINADGNIDLAVGVFKATRYDSVKRNRLFLYQVRNNAIIPLWLGTSVGHPIINFRIIQDSNNSYFVRIMGKEKSQKYLVADYGWYGFGLTLTHYIQRETTIEVAKKHLYD